MVKLSRSKIELFLKCPRCFWQEVNKGTKRPPPAPYTINSAVDDLLKREFDACRKSKTAHYLISRCKLDAAPYNSDQLGSWRDNFTGIQFKYAPADFLVCGALDDVWINPKGELIVVDFKATGAKEYKIYEEYRRQIEIYQWLLLMNKYKVCRTGYLLFAKVNKENGFKEGRLSFDLSLEPVEGSLSWIEGSLLDARKVLDGAIPLAKLDCPYCQFAQETGNNIKVAREGGG
jgi:hypothetical protein